jgi:hypothetical protein
LLGSKNILQGNKKVLQSNKKQQPLKITNASAIKPQNQNTKIPQIPIKILTTQNLNPKPYFALILLTAFSNIHPCQGRPLSADRQVQSEKC